jgi:hypothetical protein
VSPDPAENVNADPDMDSEADPNTNPISYCNTVIKLEGKFIELFPISRNFVCC